jgi:hypothetical protein
MRPYGVSLPLREETATGGADLAKWAKLDILPLRQKRVKFALCDQAFQHRPRRLPLSFRHHGLVKNASPLFLASQRLTALFHQIARVALRGSVAISNRKGADRGSRFARHLVVDEMTTNTGKFSINSFIKLSFFLLRGEEDAEEEVADNTKKKAEVTLTLHIAIDVQPGGDLFVIV